LASSVSVIFQNNPIPNGPNWVQFELSWQHNVHLVQFEFLPTEQAKTYLYYLDSMSSYTTWQLTYLSQLGRNMIIEENHTGKKSTSCIEAPQLKPSLSGCSDDQRNSGHRNLYDVQALQKRWILGTECPGTFSLPLRGNPIANFEAYSAVFGPKIM